MTLSIIIVSYNTKRLTVQCLDSIERNKPSFSYEVIVVDNGSTDGTVDAIQRKKYKNTKVLINKKNLGFAKANNKGIQKSRGSYILLLNSDTKILNTALSQLVSFAQSHPDAGLVAPRLLNVDKTIQASCFRLPTITRAVKQYWLGQAGILDKYYPETETEVVVESVVAAAILITPETRKKVGLLNETFFMYFEDLEYCKRVNKAGLHVYYVPSITIVHIHGASGKGGVNRLLIDSSKKYFGSVRYYLYTFILWSGQKIQRSFQ